MVGITGDCDHEAPRSATLEAADASVVQVRAGAGSLTIEGRSDLSEVRIAGNACASRPELLGQIQIVAEQRDGEILIESKIPDIARWNGPARLDLRVEAPLQLAFDVRDGSGSVDVRNVSATQVRDGSGSLEVEQINGDLHVRDGSGSIRIEGVTGDLQVRDGSGSVEVQGVRGSVDIRDGSGSISVEDVDGNVTVRDGSGSIAATRVTGDFTVKGDGGGGISYSEIRGRVSVPKK